MSLRRVGWLAAMFVAMVLWMSCGEVYRPVVIPISNNPPNPSSFHAVFGINSNIAPNPGTALQIDVSGDSNVGEANMGINPTHAAILPNNSRIFVTNAGSAVMNASGTQLAGYPDVVTAFSPAANSSSASGIGNTLTYTLPNTGPNQSSAITSISETGNVVTVTLASALPQAAVGGQIIISGVVIQGEPDQELTGAYNGNFAIVSMSGNTITYNNLVANLLPASGGTASVPLPTFCSYQPDFVTTTQTNAVYVANYGVETPGTGQTPNCNLPSTDSVAALNVINSTISHIQYLPAGSHPILMAETPNGQNLYVVTQGDGATPSNVLNLSTTDLSTTATIPIGVNPSWIESRPDGQRIYVITQGDGQLYSIRTDTNSVLSTQSVGVGANYILYDKSLNRLYVTNPSTNSVYVYSAATDPPTQMGSAINIAPPNPSASDSRCGNYTCTYTVMPVSVTSLPDGSRFYVASVVLGTATCNAGDPCSASGATPPPTCPDPNITVSPCLIPMLTVYDARSLAMKSGSSSLIGASLSLLSSPPFATGQFALAPNSACAPAAVYTPLSTRFRMFTTSSSDSSHVYVSICDAGAIAAITTMTNTVSQGTNESDRLVIDLQPPVSAAGSTGGAQARQNPVFLVTGQ